ncbi:MAG: cytidylate kinase-like family protein [Chloroflexota bacterium]
MIITIARQLGSGSTQIGRLVAQRLEIPYLDRQVWEWAAQKAGTSDERLEDADIRGPSLWEQVASWALQGYPSPGSSDTGTVRAVGSPESGWDQYRDVVERAMHDIAAKGDAVIVGRGSQAVLREYPTTIHVFIHAPASIRVRRVAETEHVSPDEARLMVDESDRTRALYLQAGFGLDWSDPRLYDLVVNTARLNPEEAAELIVHASRSLAVRAALPYS